MATGEPEKMPEKMNKEMPEKMLESEKMPAAPTCVEEFTKSWAQFVLGRWVLLMLLLLL